MLSRLWLALFALLVLSCTDDTIPATQVMVVVAAESSIDADAARVSLRVGGKPRDARAPFETSLERELSRSASTLAFPFSLTVVPSDKDHRRLYEIVATAFDASGARIGEARAISGFIRGKSLVLTLLLEEACRETACEADATCSRGDCVDGYVDPDSLSSFGPNDNADDVVREAVNDLPRLDGGAGSRDGGGTSSDDAGGNGADDDGGQDAGLDKDAGTGDAGMRPCPEGSVAGALGQCERREPCTTNDDCPANQECAPYEGSKACQCKLGYAALSGTSCVNVDECTYGVSGCIDACTDLAGSFQCTSSSAVSCEQGQVQTSVGCDTLPCAYTQRLPGASTSLEVIIDRSASMSSASGETGLTRLRQALAAMQTVLADRAYDDLRVELDLVPDDGDVSMCSDDSSLDFPFSRLGDTRENIRELLQSSVLADGAGSLHTALKRAHDELSDATWGRLIVVFLDGVDTCQGSSAPIMLSDISALFARGIFVLPIVAGGLSGAEATNTVALATQMAKAGGTVFTRTDTLDEMVRIIKRNIDQVDTCVRRTGLPGGLTAAVSQATLLTPDQQGLDATITITDSQLQVSLSSQACELMRGASNTHNGDWYLGYSCTP